MCLLSFNKEDILKDQKFYCIEHKNFTTILCTPFNNITQFKKYKRSL